MKEKKSLKKRRLNGVVLPWQSRELFANPGLGYIVKLVINGNRRGE